MKTLLMVLFVAFVVMPIGLSAQTEEWLWANGVGGTGFDRGEVIASDEDGNCYVAGLFHRSVTFGTINLSTLDPNGDLFLAKLNNHGVWEWVQKLHNSNEYYITITDIAFDNNNDVYLTGNFTGYMILDDITIYSDGGTDIFIAQMDPNGNWLWADNVGSIDHEYCYSIDVDQSGNIYITGQYYQTLTIGDTYLPDTGWQEIFVAKMDSTGVWIWAQHSGGTCDAGGREITVKDNGDIYVVGDVTALATFGNITFSGFNSFVAKMDNNGDWIWATGFYSVAGGSNKYVDVYTDDTDNTSIYVSSLFQGTSVFGSISITSAGSYDVFIAKLNDSGQWIWAKRGGGPNSDSPSGLVIDDNGNAYATGDYRGAANFGAHLSTSSGDSDVFVVKIDSNGNWLWIRSAGGIMGDYVQDITIDCSNNVYVTGFNYGIAVFGDYQIPQNGEGDIFVAKLGYPQIEAAFAADVLTGIQPLEVQFTDLSQPGSGPITSWFWDFGDGETSTLQNPNHTFLDAGIFDVSLTVTNTSDSTSTLILQDYITVVDDEASVLLLTDDQISFGSVYIEEISEVHTVTFQNNGSQPLTVSDDYLISNSANFEYQIPGWNYIWQPGETGDIYIRFTPQEIGAITDTLVIVNNSANQPLLKIKLSGTGLYVPLEIPTNVAITMNGDDAIVTWDPVTENLHGQPITPDYYFVWFNGLSSEEAPYYFLAPVTGTTYTHVGVALGAQYMFYRVTAVKFYRDDLSRSELDFYLNSNITPGMTEADVRAFLKQIE